MLEWGGVELRPMPLGQIAEETNHPRGHLLALPASFAWKGPRCHSLHFAPFFRSLFSKPASLKTP